MEKYKKWLVLIGATGVLFVLFYWYTKDVPPPNLPIKEEKKVQKPKEIKEQKEEARETEGKMITIDMKGAVKREGVYEMKSGLRIKDAIERAGGLTAEADVSHVNLAQFIQDQMLLYIPKKGEHQRQEVTASQKIPINIAGKEELAKITGVGPKRAEKILQYREQHGPFRKAEDLLAIEGIGEKTLEKIKEQIVVP